ncbi:hypothetical protein L6R52_15575 [Myxococcota bacterium]|nr:hypothetical protein [Myxococcota bacterium]
MTATLDRTLRVFVVLPILGALTACAAGRAMPAPTMDERPTEEGAPAEAEYERILGSFTVTPEGFVYLTPELARARLEPARAYAWRRRVRDLHTLGLPQAEAVASMNVAAIAWFDDHPEDAYRAMMSAQRLFADVGDVEGLAHVYEWLGFFFAESGAHTKAEEHLALAHALFALLGDEAAKARVLRLADE